MTVEQPRTPHAAASAPAAETNGRSEPMRALRPATNVWERYGWLMAVVWMVFLGYPVVALVRSPAALGWIVTAWVALGAFAVLYIIGFVRGLRDGRVFGSTPMRSQWGIFVALIGCAMLFIPAGGFNALSFLPFIMSFASYALTRLAHWITTLSSVGVTAVCVLLVPGGFGFSGVLAIVVLLGVVNTVSTWLIIRSAEAEALGLELATSEGREAVARDVHDLIGHSLTVVQLKAQLARRLIDADPERAKAELADIEALTAEAIAGVRATVSGVRATTLVEQVAAAHDALRAAGVTLRVVGETSALSPAQALTASWILREAVTNVLRHAKATAATITIEPGMLVIEDDGRGADGRGMDGYTGRGSGVAGMRERAAAAGAGFVITPGRDAGTRVELTW
ncbi:sensor histidine kinase [Microbacterium keratanolyticum]